MNDKYSAGLVKKSTFFREMIEVGELKLQGLDNNEIKKSLSKKIF